METITKEMLSVGMIIYDEQPRWFDYDYHPQEIIEINENDIKVFEKGYGPNGKEFIVNISSLRKKGTWIIH